MWRDYFGPKAHIYGVDIEPNTKAFEDERIRIIVGDQSDPAFLRSMVAEVPRIDILIDDGGHTMYQQEVTFKTVFPHVSPDGPAWRCKPGRTASCGPQSSRSRSKARPARATRRSLGSSRLCWIGATP